MFGLGIPELVILLIIALPVIIVMRGEKSVASAKNVASAEPEKRNAIDWYLGPLKKYADSTGRASRKEYWLFYLCNIIIVFSLTVIEGVFGTASSQGSSNFGVLGNIYWLAVLIPTLCTGVRRMHDTGRSGWWIFVPFVNFIFLVSDSEPGDNQYGANPKGVVDAATEMTIEEDFQCSACRAQVPKDAKFCHMCGEAFDEAVEVIEVRDAADEKEQERPQIDEEGRSPSRHELFLITLPLILFLTGIIVFEIKTGLIPDRFVLPAAFYFFFMSCVFGSKPWWHYLAGGAMMLGIFVFLALFTESMFPGGSMGGGSIKLLVAVGMALGVGMALQASIVFMVCVFMATLLFFVLHIDYIPSSPFVLVSTVAVYIWNFKHRLIAPSKAPEGGSLTHTAEQQAVRQQKLLK